jgi:hypothetical protein
VASPAPKQGLRVRTTALSCALSAVSLSPHDVLVLLRKTFVLGWFVCWRAASLIRLLEALTDQLKQLTAGLVQGSYTAVPRRSCRDSPSLALGLRDVLRTCRDSLL